MKKPARGGRKWRMFGISPKGRKTYVSDQSTHMAPFDVHEMDAVFSQLEICLATTRHAGMPDTAAAIETAIDVAKIEMIELGTESEE